MPLAKDQQGQVVQAVDLYGAAQSLAVGAASVQSAAFAGSSTFVRVCSDVSCRIAFGANPTAVNAGGNASAYLPANSPGLFRVNGGDKIAVIETSGGSAGTLSVVEGN